MANTQSQTLPLSTKPTTNDQPAQRSSSVDGRSSIPVPLLDLQAQYATIRDEVRAAIDRVVESQYFILGPEAQALEAEIAAYSQCAHGIGVSSGTDALLVALMAAEVGPGDEVITTPHTFFATVGCIVRLGATPVFVDIDPLTYNIQADRIAEAVTPRTKAIIPVHLFGQVAEMDPIMDVAAQHDLIVIEDAAQAIGAEYEGRRAGSIGHLGCFSFYPSKNLGGYGDGGMVVTNDAELAERVNILRKHGAQPKYHHKVVGGNFRLDAIQAAVLRVKLQHLDNWTAARQHNADRYHTLFTEAGLAVEAVDRTVPGKIGLPVELPQHRHIYNQFVIRCSRRDELMAHLKERQIGSEVYYPVPMHLQECFVDLGYAAGDFPHSECAAQETLAIPIYPELTDEMLQTVVDAIAAFYA